MSIPEGATHRMNGSFYIKKEQDFHDIQERRFPVMAWNGAEWLDMYLNDDAPLVEIKPEYMPKVGDIVDLVSKRDDLDSIWEVVLLCVGNQSVFVRGYDGESMYLLNSFDIKTHKSDRDVFIERAQEVMRSESNESKNWIAILYDNGARFIDANH